jgi:hypothetical protein
MECTLQCFPLRTTSWRRGRHWRTQLCRIYRCVASFFGKLVFNGAGWMYWREFLAWNETQLIVGCMSQRAMTDTSSNSGADCVFYTSFLLPCSYLTLGPLCLLVLTLCSQVFSTVQFVLMHVPFAASTSWSFAHLLHVVLRVFA